MDGWRYDSMTAAWQLVNDHEGLADRTMPSDAVVIFLRQAEKWGCGVGKVDGCGQCLGQRANQQAGQSAIMPA
eukprot:6091178-Alexandrium_andersonii.AAC.1